MAFIKISSTSRLRRVGSAVLLAATATGELSAAGSTPALAQIEAARTYDIPAGPLAPALNRFAAESGLRLVYAAALSTGASTEGVSGRFTAEEGLARLLAGTGISFRMTAPGTVTIAPANDAVELGPVRVEGKAIPSGDSHRDRAGTGRRVDEVIVRGLAETMSTGGTKTSTPLLETPQSVSVVSIEGEMRERGVLSIADAVAYSSGVFANTKGNTYGGDAIAVRGFGNDGTTGAATNTYMDGLRLGGTGYAVAGLDPWLYERVEVIKGPASVLYGQSTPGGLINMVSRRPRAEAGGEILARYGSFDRKQLGVDLTGPVTSDGDVLFRMTGTAFDTHDKYEFSNRKRILVAPAVTWNASDRTSLTLLANYQHDDFQGSTLNWLPTIGTVIENPLGHVSRRLFAGDPNYQRWKRTTASVGYQFEHRFDDNIALRQNFRYTHNSLDNQNTYISRLLADRHTASRQAFGLLEHSSDYTLDTHVEWKFQTGPLSHMVLAGVDWQKLDSDTVREFAVAPTLDIFAPVYFQTFPPLAPFRDQNYTNDQTGLYVQDQISLGGWRLLLGLRQDWASDSATDRPSGVTGKEKSSALTKRAALLYVFENGLAPYASYSESFTPQGGTDYLGNRFAPETGKQIEVGLKYQLPADTGFVTASVFDLRRTNVLTSDPDHPGFERLTGVIRMRGAELEANIRITPQFNAVASYTYLDPRITRSDDTGSGIDPITLTVQTRDLQGLRPYAVPKNNVALWLNYDLPYGITIGGGVRHSSATFGDGANLSRVPAFTLFDASLRIDLGQLSNTLTNVELSVKANNLFDNTYVSSCVGIDRCYYGQARSVLVDLNYRW